MLRRWAGLVIVAAAVCWLGLCQAADAPPVCQPGYVIVEEITYQEVVRKCCKVVPEKIKTRRTVYGCKTEDYCLPRCPHPWHGQSGCAEGAPAACPACSAPRTRQLLLKKEVVEEKSTFKCVVETVVEKVPCKVYRKVPCPGPGPIPAAAAKP